MTSRLDVSPVAAALAARALGQRMSYTLLIERMPSHGVLNAGTGVIEAGPRTTVYEGPGGIYVKNSNRIMLSSDAPVQIATTHGLIPRVLTDGQPSNRPRVDDLVTVIAGPPNAQYEILIQQSFTILTMDGAGRIGPIWNFQLAGLEASSRWNDPVENF